MGARRAMLTFAVAAFALACKIIPNQQLDHFNTIVHKEFKVHAVVKDQVAEVTVRPTFHNPNSFPLEGTYFLALPADAQVQDFKLVVGGRELNAELLDKEKAKDQYRRFVQEQKNPAMLELIGTQMLKANIGRIEPNADVDVVVKYTSLLPQENGLILLDVPFTNQFGADYPVPTIAVTVDMESKRAIKSIYSPTHAVDVIRRNDGQAKVSWEAKNYGPRKPFRLYYHLSDEDLGVTLLTFKQPGEDGFFALLASPKVKVENEKVLAKDVIFVFDRSGSMSGEKIQQGREALTYFIASLNDQDRFNIVDFSSEANYFESELVTASRENRARATRYAEGLKAAGSTNIGEALETAVKMVDPARMSMVIFMTDGLPTVGEQRFDKILESVRAKNPQSNPARLFVFGVGHDVNTQFLDRLAEEHRGTRDYVAPEEKIEAKLGALIHKVSNPVLGNLKLDFGGMHVQEMHPKTMPDLFAGSQLVLFGRYKTTGPAKITLTGRAAGAERTFTYNVNFPENDTRHDTVPRLWAARKIGFLMDSIRLGGSAQQEVVDEIIHLGKRYGIVTPYTAYLITEENAAAMRDDARDQVLGFADRAKASGGAGTAAPPKGESGKPADPAATSKAAQEESKKLDELRGRREADGLDYAAHAEMEKQRKAGRAVTPVKSIGAKSFFLRGGVWTDGAYDEKDKDKVTAVKYLSDDYFKLAENATLAKYLAAGEQVIVVWESKIYRVEK